MTTRNERRSARPLGVHIAALALALGFSGCVHYEPKPVSAGGSAAALESRSLDDPGLRAFVEKNQPAAERAWPLAAWTLSDLTYAAFYYHPDLEVARAKWSVAEAGRLSAGQSPSPTFSIAPGYNPTTTVPSPWFSTLALDIPIESAGKRGKRTARAGHLSEAARQNILATVWQVRAQLRKTWVDAYAAEQGEELLREQRDTQTELARLMESQLEAGAISPFELTQVRMSSNHAQLAWQEAQGQRAETRARLAIATGVPLPAIQEARLSFDDMARPPGDIPSEAARREALLHRADVLGALAEYAASESALQLEIAKQYPDLHLGPGYKYDQGDDKWSLGFTFALPILNRNQGPIAEAEALRAEAEARFNALQARAIGEVDRALATYRSALATVSTVDAMAADLETQSRAARARFDAGDISKVELARMRMELDALALARLTAWLKAQYAFGDLETALQIPLDGGRIDFTASPAMKPAQLPELKNE